MPASSAIAVLPTSATSVVPFAKELIAINTR